MRTIAWTSPVRVQAIPLPTVDGSSHGAQLSECRATLSSSGCMVNLQCEKKRLADGTCFGGQHMFVFAAPKSARGW
ncbi:UNVERIFIED_CONTAM: hypothetical protein FKN15_004410 [Acipenser sinensis]